MNRVKLLSIEFFIALFIGAGFSFLYIQNTAFFESLNDKIVDSYFLFRGEIKPSDNIVIVDIDEKSLSKLGQWPWSRNVVSKILQNLTQGDVGIIGLDIVFAESDSSSPNKVLQKLGIQNIDAPDYDEDLALALQSTPTISGYMFDFKEKIIRGVVPNISAIILEKNYQGSNYLPFAQGIISNIPILQESSYSSGFFNTIPDSDGIVRSVPLLVKYEDNIYPSLSMEILRLVYDSNKIILNYEEVGISSVIIGELSIPTDRFARLSVNYFGEAKSFKYLSAVDIYNNKFKREEIEGKIVLIGTSASGLLDLRATPYDNTYPGVEIHATVIENVLTQSFISHPNWIEAVDVIIMISLLLLITLVFSLFGALITAMLSVVSISSFVYLSYYFFINDGIVLNVIYPFMSSLFLYMVLTSLHYLFESRQKEVIKESFSKKVSKQVMDDLLSHPDTTSLSSREVEATIYFSDIRSFTTISETLKSPRRITEFLNFFMNAMVESIEKNSGTIDKFIGDAIMAYWNAPLKVENHADKAVQTALEQVAKRDKLNKTINRDFGFDVDYGIGINTGKVVVGEIGSEGRSDYTIIGDAVNLASRLEGMCKPYKVRLVISEFTKALLKEKYVIQLLDIVRVKGKHEPVKIYEVQSIGIATDEKKLELNLYDEAHTKYVNADFSSAEMMFGVLFNKYQKYLYKMYSERCKHLAQERVEGFDGVYDFTTK